MQQWKIDCEEGIANYDKFKSHRRQVAAKSSPLKVAPIAKEIAVIIRCGVADDRLKWLSSSEVKVLISAVISGAGVHETLLGRRKRFTPPSKMSLLKRAGPREHARQYSR
jgi:hypothetical protein